MLVKDKINVQRRKLNMSTAQLAEAAGVNKGSISRYENGYVKVIPVDVLHRIADALATPFEELIQGDPKSVFMSEKPAQEEAENLTLEDRQLLSWFHGLPIEVQEIIKQFWAL